MQCAVQLRLQPGRPMGLRLAQARRPAAAAPRRQRLLPAAFFNRGKDSGGDGGDAQAGANAAGSAGSQETLVSDGAIKSLSPEARRIFREAQDNIIELNKSRLRALEELKAARAKIAELEGKLENAVQEASEATAALQQLGPGGSQQAAAVGAAAAAAAQSTTPMPEVTFSFDAAAMQQQQQQQQQAAAQQQPPQQQAPAEAGPTITVVYETGWSSAFLHFNADNRGWSSPPGKKMDNGSQQFPDKKVITLPGRRMEFVINDGGNDWDKPNPWDGGRSNYLIESPGTYRVKNGKVTKLA